MTATTVYSDNVTNYLADPKVSIDRKKGALKCIVDHKLVATTSLDEVGDTTLFHPIPTNAIVTSLRIAADDLDTNATETLDINLGVVYTGEGTQKGTYTLGEAADVNLWLADSALFEDALTLTEVNDNADAIEDIVKPLWERAGLSSDPGGQFFINFTVGTNAAATAAAGDVTIIVEYF